MSALICGSMAYDNIMVFPGRFQEQILPDQIHILNVAFLVPELRREFGGCAGNIAYNLGLLGGEGYAMATVGDDFVAYQDWLNKQKIDGRYIRGVEATLTAQAYITTDLDDNQITAFHPGAMDHSHISDIPTDAGISIGMVSPDGRQGMIQHARQFAEAGIPFVFDPGQGLPMFDGDDLRNFIKQASWVAVNDYEGQMLQERTGWSEQEISQQVKGLIVTRGAKGSTIFSGTEQFSIPAVVAAEVKDPTGCGDAYRAGLLYGLLNDMKWEDTGRLAAVLGAIKIASLGTQNHSFTPQSINDQFAESFGYQLGL
ncbi:MAG: carbohydrate kinase family protein [Gammaproteobacteria bacterium]|nr:carbohydrate kinase family protein [Gammaproteobacteria bacterium]MCP4089209.1 carbohydrate kinase family protein [Gammaproteobacteria bacterium]MCP4276767.1 carbohydrate kinase family protein [Gammaproteobacteria bacterium]MCP4830610.1 carbohydrate kinase family protein [Gammaproteobacteria bacterium]MCP4928419.1 carbohydrate kinase family protein [Gammaproteobacteria bacterium]